MCATSLVPGAAVVKGLNTLSAWALQNGVLAGKQVRLTAKISAALQKADLMEVKEPSEAEAFQSDVFIRGDVKKQSHPPPASLQVCSRVSETC